MGSVKAQLDVSGFFLLCIIRLHKKLRLMINGKLGEGFDAFYGVKQFVVGGLGFEFCVFVAGWRHALRSEWPFIIIIIIIIIMVSSKVNA